jgi:hypothetical protein
MPSSIRPTRDSSLRIRVAPEEFTIRDWPLFDRPIGSLAAIALATGVSWLVGWAANEPRLGGAVAVVLSITLWRTWLPVWYTLGGSGIAQTVLRWRRLIPWMAIQRLEIYSDGVLLVPDAELTPFSPLRGLYLHWGRHRAEVLAHLEYYLHSWNHAPRSTVTEPRLP